MFKYYCFKCKKEVDYSTIDKEEICTEPNCDGDVFISVDSEGYKIEEGITCKCGETMFKRAMHLDFDKKSVSKYICTSCNAQVELVTYRQFY